MHPEEAPRSRPTPADRLQRLLAVNQLAVAELSLDCLLARIVEAARDIVTVRSAALEVIGADGAVEHFVHAGMPDAAVAAIGRMPKDLRVMEAMLSEGTPLRLDAVTLDPDAEPDGDADPTTDAGESDVSGDRDVCGDRDASQDRDADEDSEDPPVTNILGVPVHSRSAVYGNLYLAEPATGGSFTQEDEALARALAATAGTAIENARLYREASQRQRWLRASAEVSHRLLAGNDDDAALLRTIAAFVLELSDADLAGVVVPVDQSGLLEVAVSVGLAEQELTGIRYPAAGSIAGRAIAGRQGLLGHDVGQEDYIRSHLPQLRSVTEMMALPLIREGRPRGAVVAGRISARPFTATDLTMAESFASQAALALDLSSTRADRQRLEMLQERDRIARDLHDLVVQRLFGVGMRMEGLAAMTQEPMTQARLLETIDDLDSTVRQLRSSIFALNANRFSQRSARRTLLAIVHEMVPTLGFEPEVSLEGPLDTLIDDATLSDVEAVLRESLTNVAKHARASAVVVDAAVDHDRFILTVADDGIGLTGLERRGGLANLAHRAELRGGVFRLESSSEGVRLTWSTPLGL